MASIVDVATQANVAVSTVSLVLNHRERVAPKTRRRVERVIQRLGYTPRPHRRRAAGNTTPAVAVPPVQQPLKVAFIYTLETLVDDGMGTYCRRLVSGIEEQAQRSAVTVSLFRGAPHADEDPIIHDQLKRKPYDGLILLGPEPRNGYLERLLAADVPLVVFNRVADCGRFGCVTLDYFGGAAQAFEHLVALGHRRIAKPTHRPLKWLTQRQEAGACEVMARHGLEPMLIDMDLGDPGNLDASAHAFCRRALDEGATALFTGDRLAVRCADQLEAWGVRVPEDVSVIGFDNLGLRTARGQRLTSVGYSKQRMGRLAVRMLRSLVSSNGKIRSYSAAVPAHVTKSGQTTAPVRA